MWSVFLLASKGTARTLLVCTAGVYLNKTGILTGNVRKAVSQMVVNVLLPCQLFTRIVQTMRAEKLAVLLWLGLANVLYVFIGTLLGLLTTFWTRPPRGIRQIMALAPAIGHANAIPLVLLPHLCSLYEEKFHKEDARVAEGYVGLYLIMHTFTMWGVGMRVIRKPAEPQSGSTGGAAAPAQVLGRAEQNPASTDDTTSPEQVDISDIISAQSQAWAEAVSSMETGAPMPPPLRGRLSCNPQALWPEWLNRPMVACLLGVAIGLIPPLRSALTDRESIFNVPFGSMETVASAGPILALIGVGAAFVADGLPMPSFVGGYRPLLGLIVARLILLPSCALFLWGLLQRFPPPLFPRDNVFVLVVCIECIMPSAFNIVTMCTLQGIGEKEMSAALFYQYLVASVTITVWTAVILRFVV